MSIEYDFGLSFDEIRSAIAAATPIALGKAAEHVRAVAAELTPVQSGHLVGSAGVTVVGNEAQVKYAGPYARYQHYGLDFRHTKGQALFLEQPMITEADKVNQIIADTLRGAM